MAEPKITLDRFIREISRHELQVLHDDGVYRHIRGKRPGTFCMHFDIVTFPGCLAYTGDMGSFTFSRLHDMFVFFRGRRPGSVGSINPSYWAEKLEATDCNGENCRHGAAEWSDDRFKEVILELFEDHFEHRLECLDDDASEEERRSLEAMKAGARVEIENEIFMHDDLEHEGFREAMNFKHEDSGLEFPDLWEHRFTEYSLRFLWCCYAITWAIAKYDMRPASPASITWPRDSEGREVAP